MVGDPQIVEEAGGGQANPDKEPTRDAYEGDLVLFVLLLEGRVTTRGV